MKKSRKSLFLLFLIAFAMPQNTVSAQATQPSTITSRLQSLQFKATASLKSAASMLKQKSHCLISYDACSKRDKLAISAAFGFVLGYGIRYEPLMDHLFKELKISTSLTKTVTAYDIIAIALIKSMAKEAGLTGPAIKHPNVKQVGPLLLDYLKATNKNQWIADVKQVLQGNDFLSKALLIFVIAAEAIPMFQEMAYAVRYEKQFPLISLARYLKMNGKCIWDEKHCMPQKNAAQRRLGLYFWLGYLQGHVVREIKKRFF